MKIGRQARLFVVRPVIISGGPANKPGAAAIIS